MADENINNDGGDPTNEDQNAGDGASTKKTDNDDGLNLDSLSDEQKELIKKGQEMAFKSDRFKTLIQAKKERDDLKTQLQTSEERQLEENKKFEELAAKRGEKITTLEKELQSMRLHNAISKEAVKAGISDIDAAVKLMDLDQIEFDDNGNPTNITDAVGKLVETRPYLVETKAKPSVGTNMNPSDKDTSKGTTITEEEYRSKLKDNSWWKANEKSRKDLNVIPTKAS